MQGPVQAYRGLSVGEASGSGMSEEGEDVEAWDEVNEVLDWRRSAAISTMRASSSEQGSLCEAGSKDGERGDAGGDRGTRVAVVAWAKGRAACRAS